MKYAISIDWLSLYCHYEPDDTNGLNAMQVQADRAGSFWAPVEKRDGGIFGAYPFKYKLQDFGTRQFAKFHTVSMPNEEGGFDDFCEVQSQPYSNILKQNSIIVRFVNRVLYRRDFWELAERFLSDNHFTPKGITRIDICADFNQFDCIAPLDLIKGFAAEKYRHIGRGVGALYFNHQVIQKRYGVNYTGLSFGTHASDAHIYLYNKSFELLTQKDKPYIRDLWNSIGLDVREVWRLEVSIKSKGTKFKDKSTGEEITIDRDRVGDSSELSRIYHTFVAKMFAFIVNREDIKNITREPRLKLFDGAPCYDRGVIRNLSCGDRMDRMVIKALWQLGDRYRGATCFDFRENAQAFALDIAESCDLGIWMGKKIKMWEKPTHK